MRVGPESTRARPRTTANSWTRRRGRRPRCHRPRGRAARTPWPADGRDGSPGAHRATGRSGRIEQPVRPRPARRHRSCGVRAARSPSRSLSFSRMNPTPVIRVGVTAWVATTASVGNEVGHVGHVDVEPAQRRVTPPHDDRVVAASRRGNPSTPARRRIGRRPAPRSRPRPRTHTAPPTMAAAASG